MGQRCAVVRIRIHRWRTAVHVLAVETNRPLHIICAMQLDRFGEDRLCILLGERERCRDQTDYSGFQLTDTTNSIAAAVRTKTTLLSTFMLGRAAPRAEPASQAGS